MFAALLQVIPVPVATSPSKLVVIATILVPVVYMLVALLKQAMPNLSGVWAIIVNFVVSVVGFLMLVPQAQWFTMTTLMALSVTIAGAAGIHGTVRSLSAPTPAASLPQPSAAADIPLAQSVTRRPDLP